MKSDKSIRGIQSIEVSGTILEALETIRIPASLSHISKVTGMSQAKLHPYLVSMLRTEMVERLAGGEYIIGRLPRELGYIGLHYLNPSQEADYFTKKLNSTSGHAAVVSVWGTLGPTITSFYNAKHELYTELRTGSVMSMMHSSLGRTFSAFMPEAIVNESLKYEKLRNKGSDYTDREHEKFMEDIRLIRSRGYDLMKDSPLPSLSSLSAPVFGVSQNIELVITISNKSCQLDINDGAIINELLSETRQLSRNLGFNQSGDGF